MPNARVVADPLPACREKGAQGTQIGAHPAVAGFIDDHQVARCVHRHEQLRRRRVLLEQGHFELGKIARRTAKDAKVPGRIRARAFERPKLIVAARGALICRLAGLETTRSDHVAEGGVALAGQRLDLQAQVAHRARLAASARRRPRKASLVDKPLRRCTFSLNR